jgi:hypothetical protein
MKKKQIEKGRKQPKPTARQSKAVEKRAPSSKLKSCLGAIIGIFAFVLYEQSMKTCAGWPGSVNWQTII